MKKKLKDSLGDLGVIIYFLLSLFVSIMPFVMIGKPFWVNMILIAIAQLIPFTTIGFWVWGLFCAYNGPQDWLANTYYILFGIAFVPFISARILELIDKKENDPNEIALAAAKRIIKSWGGNIHSLSITEKIVLHHGMLLTSFAGQSDYFSNNYVCADALVIACTYAAYIFKVTKAPQSFISDIETQVLCVLQDIFSISPPVAKRLYNDRFSHFTSIIANCEDDVMPLIEEASMLFSHDLYHNKYVPYDASSPVPVMSFEKQFAIDAESKAYFNQVLQFTTETFESYL